MGEPARDRASTFEPPIVAKLTAQRCHLHDIERVHPRNATCPPFVNCAENPNTLAKAQQMLRTPESHSDPAQT